MMKTKNYPKNHQNSLKIEVLEPRRLLATIINGFEADGDEYEIKLNGPGTIVDGSLENLTLTNTNVSSNLHITVSNTVADGILNVAEVDTLGANLGRLKIQGNLGALHVGKLNHLEVQTLGDDPIAARIFNIAGNVQSITVPGGITDSNLSIAGSLNRLLVGERDDIAANISNSTISVWGDVTSLRLRQSLTGDSSITIHGDLNNARIEKSLMSSTVVVDGDVETFKVDGAIRNDSILSVGGDLTYLKIRKTVSDSDFSVGGNLLTAKFGNDFRNSTMLAQAVDNLLIKDDLDQSQIGVTGDLLKLKANDSQSLTLRISGTLQKMQIKNDLDQALVSVLNEIGTIKIGQDLFRSTILGGIDIGDDFAYDTAPGGDDTEWGNVFVNNITINGDMIDSNIAAGVSSRGDFYGDGDDEPTADDVGTARILKVVVKGEISSTGLPGESYAISAADGIDIILSGRKSFTGNAGVLRQEF
ncbi:MAG: hypothetical protein GY869_12920 [Planctomycetes bacterium]|nr:hypothetical protein [Planctomycetota bacterium]